MPSLRCCLTASVLAWTALQGEQVQGLPLHVQKLGPGTLRLWLGDTGNSTATLALATQKGIVVVDTLGIPVVDRELRRIIAREFGRQDFKLLVNTHEHADHTLGNEAYADCAIVAHESCAAGMQAQQAFLPDWSTFARKRIQALEAEQARRPEAGKAKGIAEELILTRLNLAAYTQAKPTFPNRTFRDRLTLDRGDTTLELYAIGGLHSPSDIAIHVPQRGLLLTGDTMADGWLTDAPGCLAAFTLPPGQRPDFKTLLGNWAALSARSNQVQTLVPGHWNATLSWKGFQQRIAYVKALHDGIQAGVKAECPLGALLGDFPLRSRFPELVDSPGITPQNHQQTLVGIYAALTGTTSAAGRIQACLGHPDAEREIAQVLADRGAKPARYYFLEGEFNARAYRLLQMDQIPQALALFKACAEAFPGSWNAQDSLAEGHAKAGNRDLAIAHYRKSLSLNPGNRNGEAMLQKLGALAP